jgi:hypothetical protein
MNMGARLALAVALAVAAAGNALGFEFVRAGRPVATIVAAEGAPDTERFAASELQVYIERMSGVRLPIVNKAPDNAEAVALVGIGALRQAGDNFVTAAQLDQIQNDGYSAVTIAGRTPYLILVGKIPRGTLYAVYDLLDNQLDCGFFVDGDKVNRRADVVVPPINVVANPAFTERTYWLPTRLYGPKRFQATLWNADEWRAFLRWIAKKKMNRVAIPFTTATRAWGTAFDQAFPEAKAHRREALQPEGAQGGSVTAQMGWGLSPEHTTDLLKQVLDYARRIPGIEVTYVFCLGDFEQGLRQARPNLKWKPPVPLSFPAVAGGSCLLSSTEPGMRELQGKLWKAIIETYGTDHNYVVCCQEPPGPVQAAEPAENATALALQIIKEVDPAAKATVPTWESDLWGSTAEAQTLFIRQLPEGVALLYAEPDFTSIRRMFDAARGFLPPPTLTPTVRPMPPRGILYTDTQFFADRPFHYALPWGGAASNDLSENRFGMLDNCFHHFQHFTPKPKAVGFWNWNEARRVNPMMDDLSGEFAWSAAYVWRAEGASTNRIVHRYMARRYTPAAVFPMAEAHKEAMRGAPRADANVNYRAYLQWSTVSAPGSASSRTAIALALGAKAQAEASPFYEPDLVDIGRNCLHQYIQQRCAQIIAAVRDAKRVAATQGYTAQVKSQSQAQLQKLEAELLKAHTTLTRLIATRKDMCLDEAILEAVATKGANKNLARAIREHQSGLFAAGYPLTDSIEYHQQVATRQLRFLLDYAKRELDAPTQEAVPGWERFFTQGAQDFIDKAQPQPYDGKAEKTPPSTILQEFLQATD